MLSRRENTCLQTQFSEYLPLGHISRPSILAPSLESGCLQESHYTMHKAITSTSRPILGVQKHLRPMHARSNTFDSAKMSRRQTGGIGHGLISHKTACQSVSLLAPWLKSGESRVTKAPLSKHRVSFHGHSLPAATTIKCSHQLKLANTPCTPAVDASSLFCTKALKSPLYNLFPLLM